MNGKLQASLDSRHRDTYGVEAPFYDANRFVSRRGRLYNYFELEAIIRLLAPLEGRQVLDVASGTGRVALALASHGATVTSTDLTSEMLDVTRRKAVNYELAALHCVNANGQRLPFSANMFDIVTCVRFLHLLPPKLWGLFVEDMRRVLKPDGLLMIELFNPLYGGPLALLREFIHKIKREPLEHYIWPNMLGKMFTGLNVMSVTSFWLPGMGLLAREDSVFFHRISQACAQRPLNWIAGPHLVLARPRL